jgi:hypothetical protein
MAKAIQSHFLKNLVLGAGTLETASETGLMFAGRFGFVAVTGASVAVFEMGGCLGEGEGLL